MLDYADLFSIVLRNDNIQEFDTRWNEICLFVEQCPLDAILDSLYKLRIRESEKLKTVLKLYNLEVHQKNPKLDYHRLKTMVKRSIEQFLRTRNFEARNGRIESNMLVKNKREQRHVLKGQGGCWQWKATGQSSKGVEMNSLSQRYFWQSIQGLLSHVTLLVDSLRMTSTNREV